ncbi:MAG: hypothetical protein QXO27_04380 [Candidatus Aenigmatarchaeota archaeon]
MKAQISFVEYLVAFVIFVSFVGYFSFQLVRLIPEYLNQIRMQRIKSEAYQISELLMNDPGYPINWNVGNVQRLGLSDETKNLTNFLSLNKINAIGDGINLCKPGYENVKKWVGSDYDFSIIFIRKSPAPELTLIGCRPSVTAVKAINVTIRRIAFFGSGYGELIVQMW